MDATIALGMTAVFGLFICGSSLSIYVYLSAISYVVTREKMRDAIQLMENGKLEESARVIFGYRTAFNPHLIRLPSVAYLLGKMLVYNDDKRGIVFIDYAARHSANFNGPSIDPIDLKKAYEKDLEVVSKKLVFRAVDSRGLLRLMTWFFVGVAVLQLIMVLVKLVS